jgi:hypothetical protein
VVFWGCWRVEGVLAVSRAVGDRLLKDYVTAEPEITETPISSDDKFLVRAASPCRHAPYPTLSYRST